MLCRNWAWTLWRASVPVPEGKADQIKLVCKAVDSDYNTQPESPDAIWNLRGVLNNAWHEVHVKIE